MAAPIKSDVTTVAPSRFVGGVTWYWPITGPLLRRFRHNDPIPGIAIGAKAGTMVHAAASGVVVYSGNGLVGYGQLIIIKHNDNLLSAYGRNGRRLVQEGQRVEAGQIIAVMGSTDPSNNALEFQIRKNGHPVNPLHYLPQH